MHLESWKHLSRSDLGRASTVASSESPIKKLDTYFGMPDWSSPLGADLGPKRAGGWNGTQETMTGLVSAIPYSRPGCPDTRQTADRRSRPRQGLAGWEVLKKEP